MYADWVLFIAMFLCKSLDLMICITLLFGLFTTIRVNVGYVYMMELMPKRLQSNFSSAYNTLEGSILLIGTLYYWYISKHWMYYAMIGFALNTWCCIACLFLPESPRLLIEQ